MKYIEEKEMDSISSLNRLPATTRDLKAEASAALDRDPHRQAARKRNRRHKENEPDDEFEIDTFEHAGDTPRDH
jgi:hypothetical protein